MQELTLIGGTVGSNSACTGNRVNASKYAAIADYHSTQSSSAPSSHS
jgi:hypothetical protein